MCFHSTPTDPNKSIDPIMKIYRADVNMSSETLNKDPTKFL